jgi:excisionase family DNA binding protein
VIVMPTTWMTRKEAALYLRTTTKTLDRLTAAGQITKHYLAGSKVLPRFRKDELDALMTTEEGATEAS